MIATLLEFVASKEAEGNGTHKRDCMEKQNNNKPLGIMERLALLAVPILFTVLIVADAVHVI